MFRFGCNLQKRSILSCDLWSAELLASYFSLRFLLFSDNTKKHNACELYINEGLH